MTETSAEAPPAAQAPDAGPAPLGPISSRGETAPTAGDAGTEIDFDLPAGWQSEPPTSSMRLAQATIPGPQGNGQLAVFYFGPGGGGDVDSNIQRWVGQMEPEQKGGLLVAPLGQGHYIYTGLAFFRQLPAGVPGAYRLFANLLAIGR